MGVVGVGGGDGGGVGLIVEFQQSANETQRRSSGAADEVKGERILR